MPGVSDGMEFVPERPTNLQDLVAITDDSRVAFSWEDGASDGDSAVLDWRVTYDESTGNWVTLEPTVNER